jgi:hypothetical protein
MSGWVNFTRAKVGQISTSVDMLYKRYGTFEQYCQER